MKSMRYTSRMCLSKIGFGVHQLHQKTPFTVLEHPSKRGPAIATSWQKAMPNVPSLLRHLQSVKSKVYRVLAFLENAWTGSSKNTRSKIVSSRALFCRYKAVNTYQQPLSRALSRSPQHWSSYISFLRDIVQTCFALTQWQDTSTIKNLYKNMTSMQQLLIGRIFSYETDRQERETFAEQRRTSWQEQADETIHALRSDVKVLNESRYLNTADVSFLVILYRTREIRKAFSLCLLNS